MYTKAVKMFLKMQVINAEDLTKTDDQRTVQKYCQSVSSIQNIKPTSISLCTDKNIH